MLGLALRELQTALHEKADRVQREFVSMSEDLDGIGKKIIEASPEELALLKEEQERLRLKQLGVADEINSWRKRARDVMHLGGEQGTRAFIDELEREDDDLLLIRLKSARRFLDMTEDEMARLGREATMELKTPAARLIERARTSYDMRGSDSIERMRAAVEFVNRSGIAQDDDVLREVESAMEDDDPLVRETLILTSIQIHRFRAVRVADLDVAHESVKRLAGFNHPAAVPVLIEVLENPRTGFMKSRRGAEEGMNGRSRMVALLRLVEWHTAEAREAIRKRLYDQDSSIVRAAQRALELFPDPWSGPLKRRSKP